MPTRGNEADRVWQPKNPVFWVIVAMTLCLGYYIVDELVAGANSPLAFVVAMATCAVQGVLLWLMFRAIPRFHRLRPALICLALVWGGFVSAGVASLANTESGDALTRLGLQSLSASISAPINEDIMRLLGVLAMLGLMLGRKITAMDGALIGFVVGSGFELVENALYVVSKGSLGESLQAGLLRLLAGFGAHTAWTTVAGAGLAYCLSRRQRGLPGRWWVLVVAFLLPALSHAAWDAPKFTLNNMIALLGMLVMYAIIVLMFLVTVRLARRSEFQWYRDTVPGALPREEFRKLPRKERKRLAEAAVVLDRRVEATQE